MKIINWNKSELALWASGNGTISIEVEDPLAPLTPQNSRLLQVAFQTGGDPIRFGTPGTTQLAVSANTSATLQSFWPPDYNAEVLKRYRLEPRERDVLLALTLGASAGVEASTNLPARLGAGATLALGADASYVFIRTLDGEQQGLASHLVLTQMLQSLRMPGDAIGSVRTGDIISLEYGGYVRLGASLTAGYEMQGSASAELGKIDLSEKISFAALGTLSLSAEIAGRFEVELRGVEAPAGAPGRWVKVRVRRARGHSLGVAADLKLNVTNNLDGLPGTSEEFLAAVLGTTSHNWLNYLNRVASVKSFEELEEITDTLSWHYLSQLVNRGQPQIRETLDDVLGFVKKVSTASARFDARALKLLDKYVDRISTALVPALEKVERLTSWKDALTNFSPNLSPEAGLVIAILTDGDPRYPLGWISNLAPSAKNSDEGIGELQERAKSLLELLREEAHVEVLKAIGLAKSSFSIDTLFASLGKIATVEQLREIANEKLGGFASRLVGRALTAVQKNDEFKGILKKLQKVNNSRRQFQETLYRKATEAVNRDYGLSLRAEYQKATTETSLIEATVNADSDAGHKALLAISDGEFDRLFADYDPSVIQIDGGVFATERKRKRAFSVNIFGWHDNFNYEHTAIDELIVASNQHIKTESDGSLSIYTQFSLEIEKTRRSGLTKSEEIIRTNFLLQCLGESKGVVEFDNDAHEFLLSSIRTGGARYAISFLDSDTDPQELAACLKFAEELKILGSATPQEIARSLPMQNNSYGSVEADYEVRFTPEGMDALFSKDLPDSDLRQIMRKMVLMNYLTSRHAALIDIAWAYWTPGVYPLWSNGQAAFVNNSNLEFAPIARTPFVAFAAPSKVTLRKFQLQNLSTLYFIEDGFIAAIEDLRELLNSEASEDKLSPSEFARRLEAFGKALAAFDDFDQGVNTLFALFDQIIGLSLAPGRARSASLSLKANCDGAEVRQLFASLPPAV